MGQNTELPKAPSLQRQLLMLVLVPLGFLVLANSYLSLNAARTTAGLIMDRTLLASARSMAEQIHVVNGVLEVNLLPSSIEMLASGEHDLIFYQIRAPDGELLAGVPDLPMAKAELKLDEADFHDINFRLMPLRIVQLVQPVPQQYSAGVARIAVGETLIAREKLTRELWFKGLQQQTLMVLAAGVMIWLGLKRGLAPLKHLRDEVRGRREGTLTRLDAPDAPAEVQPLVAALNDYMARLSLLIETQRRFIANATHQLRTPLTLLRTQASFGMREASLAGKDDALGAIRTSVDHLTRLTNQLLVLARAEPGTSHGARVAVDLLPMAAKVLADFSSAALDKQSDLGLDADVAELTVHGNPTLLRELISNLIDNALRYTPPGGTVTLFLRRSGQEAILRVEDNGPGIPAQEREKVFERFYRLDASKAEGSGLGLAIVREILTASEGTITLKDPPSGMTGLVVEVRLPLSEG